MPDLRRIEREIRDCVKDKVNIILKLKESNVNVQPINDNLLHLKGDFNGY
jgi:hypothetical protein